jgi:hypothetical protein
LRQMCPFTLVCVLPLPTELCAEVGDGVKG